MQWGSWWRARPLAYPTGLLWGPHANMDMTVLCQWYECEVPCGVEQTQLLEAEPPGSSPALVPTVTPAPQDLSLPIWQMGADQPLERFTCFQGSGHKGNPKDLEHDPQDRQTDTGLCLWCLQPRQSRKVQEPQAPHPRGRAGKLGHQIKHCLASTAACGPATTVAAMATLQGQLEIQIFTFNLAVFKMLARNSNFLKASVGQTTYGGPWSTNSDLRQFFS